MIIRKPKSQNQEGLKEINVSKAKLREKKEMQKEHNKMHRPIVNKDKGIEH